MRGSLHCGDQRFAGEITLEAAEFFGGDDDHFVTAMHGNMLRPLAANPTRMYMIINLYHT